jgi:hypothetical protein
MILMEFIPTAQTMDGNPSPSKAARATEKPPLATGASGL